MRERTTIKTLDLLAGIINEITGQPKTYFAAKQPTNGSRLHQTNGGHYYIQHQTGGYRLEQTCTDGHGARDVFPYRTTKGQLENDMRRFIEGLELGKDLNEQV